MSKKVLQKLASQIDRAAKLRKGREMRDYAILSGLTRFIRWFCDF